MSQEKQTHHVGSQPRTDCPGVSLDALLSGQESQCPQCEDELSTIRASQVQKNFTVSSELDRLIDWPML